MISYIPPPSQPARCPHCLMAEDTKTLCRHCGYEYPETDDNFNKIAAWCGLLALIAAVIGGVYLFPLGTPISGDSNLVYHLMSGLLAGILFGVIEMLIWGLVQIFKTIFS